MTVTVVDGWIIGELPGPGGKMFKVELVKRTSPAPKTLAIRPPNLLLHTTETDGLGTMPQNHLYPPNFWCGDDRIVQSYRVNQGGHSTDEVDGDILQVENVDRSQVGVWLFKDSTLHPLVALTAFLHDRRLIKTGLKRPKRLKDVPVGLDRLPAAVDTYYRRGPVTAAGVYGHVDAKGDEHWDPGGFNYPMFFEMVRAVLGGEEDEMLIEVELEAYRGRWNKLVKGEAKPRSGRQIKAKKPKGIAKARGEQQADADFAAIKAHLA